MSRETPEAVQLACTTCINSSSSSSQVMCSRLQETQSSKNFHQLYGPYIIHVYSRSAQENSH